MRTRTSNKSHLSMQERLPQLPENQFWRVHNTATGHTFDGDYTYEVTDRVFIELHEQAPRLFRKDQTKIFAAETINPDRYSKSGIVDMIVDAAKHILQLIAEDSQRAQDIHSILGDYS